MRYMGVSNGVLDEPLPDLKCSAEAAVLMWPLCTLIPCIGTEAGVDQLGLYCREGSCEVAM